MNIVFDYVFVSVYKVNLSAQLLYVGMAKKHSSKVGGTRAANSKELDHFAELELELEKKFFLNSNLNSHKTVRVH